MAGQRVVPPEADQPVQPRQQPVEAEVRLWRRLGGALVIPFPLCFLPLVEQLPSSAAAASLAPSPKLPPPPPRPPALPPPLDDPAPRPSVDVRLRSEILEGLHPPERVRLGDVGDQGARKGRGGDGGGRERGEDGGEAVAVEVEEGGRGGKGSRDRGRLLVAIITIVQALPSPQEPGRRHIFERVVVGITQRRRHALAQVEGLR